MKNLNFWSKFFILNFWRSQYSRLLRPCTKWRGQKNSWNSEVETAWISLISWHHKTSNKYLYNQKVPTLCCKSIDSPNFLLEIRVIIEIGSFHDTSLSGWNKKIILNSWNENKWIQQCNFFQIHQFSTFHFEKNARFSPWILINRPILNSKSQNKNYPKNQWQSMV